MALTSLVYIAFLAVCTAVMYLVKPAWQNYVLLFFSVGFIAWAMPMECIVLFIIVLAVYFAGIIIGATEGKTRSFLFILTVIFAVFMLYIYKYSGMKFVIPVMGGISLVAPIGLSYVMLECISYLVEIKQGKMRPETNPVNFLLYALFFAKLTAGPIEKPKEFLAGLSRERRFSRANAENGVALIAVGFIKKLAIADVLSPFVDKAFSSSGLCGAIPMIAAAVMYSVQILADFSGYTDIARGSAMILGIKLTENFNRPYEATSVRDFWRRWHISLSTWLRDYIYIPLGGSRCPTAQRFLNIAVTFIVSGIWHGAGFNYIVWGALHGIYQIIEILGEKPMAKLRSLLHIKEDGKLHTWISRISTFLAVTFAWIFFRADDLSTAIKIVRRLFSKAGNLSYFTNQMGITAASLLLIAAGFLAERFIRREIVISPSSPKYKSAHTKVSFATVIILTAIAMVTVYLATASTGGGSSFIYFNF